MIHLPRKPGDGIFSIILYEVKGWIWSVSQGLELTLTCFTKDSHITPGAKVLNYEKHNSQTDEIWAIFSMQPSEGELEEQNADCRGQNQPEEMLIRMLTGSSLWWSHEGCKHLLAECVPGPAWQDAFSFGRAVPGFASDFFIHLHD